MRIGLDAIPLATPKTGIGHYTFELACALAAFAPTHDFDLVAPVPLPAEVSDELAADAPGNLRAVYAPINAVRKHWWTIGLPLYVNRHPLALFHGTNYNIPLWRRCPTVVTIHDLSLLLHAHTHPEELVRRARRRLPTMARAATKIITDSESVKKEIRTHLNVRAEKIAVVPLAPRRLFRPAAPAQVAETLRRLAVEDNFILFVGTVEPRKNLITLARAFAELLEQTDLHPQLVIAGQKGWLPEELDRHLEKSGVREHIRFTGYVSDEDLRALYTACAVCAYPSLYEGFGLPPLEAMSCGAPVITSRLPVLQETVGAAARLVEPTDATGLARALHELLRDASAREYHAAAGLRHAATFTWERTARQTFAVYEEVLRSAGLSL